MISRVLQQAKLRADQLDAVAVTRGPGLAGCLDVGIQAAQALVRSLQSTPLVAVNHMEGHALVARLTNPEIQFPFLTLLISGGHTQLVVCRAVGDYAMLGDSLDDAVGECIDKVARTLQLEFRGGGGKALEELARLGTASHSFGLQVPLQNVKNCDFSFSGLKTAAIAEVTRNQLINTEPIVRANFAASFQDTIILHLVDRFRRAAQWCRLNEPQVRTFVVSGGVACNQAIRTALSGAAAAEGLELKAPPAALCTDNGVMIAWAGLENLLVGKNVVEDIDSLRYIPRMLLDPSKTDYFPGSHVKHNKSSLEASIASSKAAIDAGGATPSLYFKLARDSARMENFREALQFCTQGLQVRCSRAFPIFAVKLTRFDSRRFQPVNS